MSNHVINVPRSEAVALIQSAVDLTPGGVGANTAILLKRQAEKAPVLAFNQCNTIHEGVRCACPAVRAGVPVSAMKSEGWNFAGAFDRLVCETYGLDVRYDSGVLVIQ